MSISEIKKRYEIKEDDLEEIRAILKNLLKQNHPDNNSENYNIDYFEQIKKDLKYIEEQIDIHKMLISEEDITHALMTTIRNYPVKTRQEELQEKLEKNTNEQIVAYKRKITTRRYSLAIITAILTFLWMIPEQVASHPILEALIFRPSVLDIVRILSIIWGISCFITVCYWIKTASAEQKERNILKQVKLESVQNKIFISFIKKLEDKKVFSKEEFMDYIKYYYMFKRMDETVVQNIADIILDKALSLGKIKESETLGLIECYRIMN